MNTTPDKDVEYVTQTDLKKVYRFTTSWIDRLGEPDKIKTNPHYSSGLKMKLFKKDRVLLFIAENSEEYVIRCKKAEQRSGQMTEVISMKMHAAIEWAEQVPIQITKLPSDLAKACEEHLQNLHLERNVSSDIKRITSVHIQNMIRHEFSNYEGILHEFKGEVGRWEAYAIVKRRVNEAIGAVLKDKGIS